MSGWSGFDWLVVYYTSFEDGIGIEVSNTLFIGCC